MSNIERVVLVRHSIFDIKSLSYRSPLLTRPSRRYLLTMSKPEAAEPAVKEARRIDVAGTASKIISNIEKVIIGKRPQITMAVISGPSSRVIDMPTTSATKTFAPNCLS